MTITECKRDGCQRRVYARQGSFLHWTCDLCHMQDVTMTAPPPKWFISDALHIIPGKLGDVYYKGPYDTQEQATRERARLSEQISRRLDQLAQVFMNNVFSGELQNFYLDSRRDSDLSWKLNGIVRFSVKVHTGRGNVIISRMITLSSILDESWDALELAALIDQGISSGMESFLKSNPPLGEEHENPSNIPSPVEAPEVPEKANG